MTSTDTLTVTVSGVALATTPSITVTPGAVSPTNSTVTLASPTVAAGSPDVITIAVKDAGGNPITGLPSSAFAFALSGGTSTGTFGTVTESTTTPGTYACTFTGGLV